MPFLTVGDIRRHTLTMPSDQITGVTLADLVSPFIEDAFDGVWDPTPVRCEISGCPKDALGPESRACEDHDWANDGWD